MLTGRRIIYHIYKAHIYTTLVAGQAPSDGPSPPVRLIPEKERLSVQQFKVSCGFPQSCSSLPSGLVVRSLRDRDSWARVCSGAVARGNGSGQCESCSWGSQR